ncbi:MAG: hypothetical protein HY035_11525 [Nitrospirae bacterium]|nr:hypothetical protein [Nitrospirota bacterium]MBI3379012.1 hypothetical protein [Nitrospirota bacterium]
MVTLSKDSSDRRITIAFSYNPTLVQKIKTIPNHSKTTEIYSQVSNKALMKIRNPLDQILEGKGGG